MGIELVSIEVTNRCSKGCAFCYARSGPSGSSAWTVDALVSFVADLARGGVRSASFGGGEPLEFPGLFEVLARTRGLLHRSLTTNGLLLDEAAVARLAEAGLEKAHVSVHFPEAEAEVERALRAVRKLEEAGTSGGVNLLVRAGGAAAARRASLRLRQGGVGPAGVVLIPMRLENQPTLREIVEVGGGEPFQSMSCLLGCAASPRFCSVAADRSVAACSYTRSRAPLEAPTHRAMLEALESIRRVGCGEPVRGQPARKPVVVRPAAHSMDTDWFAVDEEGHVAEFDSGEAGAVPESFLGRAGHQYSADDLYEAALMDPANGVRLDIADLLAEPDGHLYRAGWDDVPTAERVDASMVSTYDSYLVWLSEEVMLAQLPGFVRVDAGASQLVAFGRTEDAAVVRRLMKARGFRKGWMGLRLRGERLGFYRYDHGEWENWTSGPYKRLGVPAHPVRIEQLQGQVREIAQAARFAGVRFAKEERVQPVHHAPCSSHQGTFVPAYQDVLLPFERGEVPRVPRGRPDVHVYLAAGLEALDAADRPAGPFHAGGPVPRVGEEGCLRLMGWLVRALAPEAPKADQRVVAAIAEQFERFVERPVVAAQPRYGGLEDHDLSAEPELVRSLAQAARAFPTDSSFVALVRGAAAAAVYFNGRSRAGASGCLVRAVEQATMLVAVGAARPAGCPDAAALLRSFDQQLLRIDLAGAFEAWQWEEAPAFAEILWRAAGADGKSLDAVLVRLAGDFEEPRYGLAVPLGGARKWFEGPRDDVLSTVPEALFASATAAVLGALGLAR